MLSSFALFAPSTLYLLSPRLRGEQNDSNGKDSRTCHILVNTGGLTSDDKPVQDEVLACGRLRARVCVGMPVHNGQKHLAQAMEAILTQTFCNLELIISDNASTDATAEICKSFAHADSRVTYLRLSQNIGTVQNFQRVYQLSGGQYFKWATDRDLIEPTFIEKCVLALDANPTSVLACPQGKWIDSYDRSVGDCNLTSRANSNLPAARFASIAAAAGTCDPQIYGLMRRSAINLIPPVGDYPEAERVFLARLALYGKFLEMPDRLLLIRDRSIRGGLNADQSGESRFPEFRVMWEYLKSIQYGWLNTAARAACVAAIVVRQISRGHCAQMMRDIVHAGERLLHGPARSMNQPATFTAPASVQPLPRKAAA